MNNCGPAGHGYDENTVVLVCPPPPPAHHSSLPVTGFDVGLIAIAGLAAFATGLIFRRRSNI